MADRLTPRQRRKLLTYMYEEKKFVLYGLVQCSFVLLILAIPATMDVPERPFLGRLLSLNFAIVLFGLPMALLLPLRDVAFDAQLAPLPIARKTIARSIWVWRILVAPAIVTQVPLVPVFSVMRHKGKLDHFDLQLLLVLSVAFLTLSSFLGTWAWLLHPQAKRYRLLVGTLLFGFWLCIPLDVFRWTPLHWVLAPLCVGLGLSSYLAAPVLFGRPERALLGEIPQNFYQRCKRYVQRRVGLSAPGFDLTDHWLQPVFGTTLFASVLVMHAYEDGFAVILMLWYATFFVPLREPWRHDLSVIRSVPVGSQQFIRKTVGNYLLADAIVAVLIVPWLVLAKDAWTAEHLMLACVIAGHGFFARTLLWMVMPDRLINHVMTGLMFIAGALLVADIVSGYWGQWFERTFHVLLPMDYHQLLWLLAITAPVALIAGAWILHRVMTRNMSIYHGRRTFGNLEFN